MSQEAEEATAKHPATRTHGCEEAKLTAVRSNHKRQLSPFIFNSYFSRGGRRYVSESCMRVELWQCLGGM